MTCEVFLLGIAMLSRTNWSIFWKVHGSVNGEPVTRERKPVDDIRVLFQSMAIGASNDVQNPGKCGADDDEDLLDVLVASMGRRATRENTMVTYMRQDFLGVAAALPSSFSRSIHKVVKLEELRLLLELVVVLSTRFMDESGGSTPGALECLMESFSRHTYDHKDIGWEPFRAVVLHSFV